MTLQKYTSLVADLEKDVKNCKIQLNKKSMDLDETLKEKVILTSNISDISKKAASLEESVKQKIMENNKLKDSFDSFKEEFYRVQHLNADMNTCVSSKTFHFS